MSLRRQFLHFAAVGACGTLVQYLCLWIGVNIFASTPAVASGIGYLLGAVVNYLLNYFLTFKSGQPHRETAPRYYAMLAMGWSINTGLMMLMAELWLWPVFLAQVIATGIGLIFNFICSRFWVFQPRT